MGSWWKKPVGFAVRPALHYSNTPLLRFSSYSPFLAGAQVGAQDDGGGIDEQDRAEQDHGGGERNGVLHAGHLGGKRVEMHGESHALFAQAVRKQIPLLHGFI